MFLKSEIKSRIRFGVIIGILERILHEQGNLDRSHYKCALTCIQ